MKERPILMSPPMVRAILDGTKSQTRRVIPGIDHGTTTRVYWADSIETVPRGSYTGWVRECDAPLALPITCRLGAPGDRLWVRETWQHTSTRRFGKACVAYRAGGSARDAFYEDNGEGDFARIGGLCVDEPTIGKWHPSILMPRGASRITLEITDVRAERLQDISEEDARAEGAQYHDGHGVGHSGWRHDRDHGVVYATARDSFFALWERINGKRDGCRLQDNPWCWALTFAVKP